MNKTVRTLKIHKKETKTEKTKLRAQIKKMYLKVHRSRKV